MRPRSSAHGQPVEAGCSPNQNPHPHPHTCTRSPCAFIRAYWEHEGCARCEPSCPGGRRSIAQGELVLAQRHMAGGCLLTHPRGAFTFVLLEVSPFMAFPGYTGLPLAVGLVS